MAMKVYPTTVTMPDATVTDHAGFSVRVVGLSGDTREQTDARARRTAAALDLLEALERMQAGPANLLDSLEIALRKCKECRLFATTEDICELRHAIRTALESKP